MRPRLTLDAPATDMDGIDDGDLGVSAGFGIDEEVTAADGMERLNEALQRFADLHGVEKGVAAHALAQKIENRIVLENLKQRFDVRRVKGMFGLP